MPVIASKNVETQKKAHGRHGKPRATGSGMAAVGRCASRGWKSQPCRSIKMRIDKRHKSINGERGKDDRETRQKADVRKLNLATGLVDDLQVPINSWPPNLKPRANSGGSPRVRECKVRQDLQARLPSKDLGVGQDQRLTERCLAPFRIQNLQITRSDGIRMVPS